MAFHIEVTDATLAEFFHNDAEDKLTKIEKLVTKALKAKKPTVETLKNALEEIQEALASK